MIVLDAVPSQVEVVARKCGVFGGSITVRDKVTENEVSLKKKELWSALQKGIRLQDEQLACRVACTYVLLVQSSKAGCTWLFNRLVIIAKEDCAASYASFAHAYALFTRYKDGKEPIALSDILRTVRFMCTQGTSRLPSHMRALVGTRPLTGSRGAGVVAQIVRELKRCKVGCATLADVGKITALAGNIKAATPFYRAVQALVEAERRERGMTEAHARACLALISFVKQFKGNAVESRTRKGQVRRDHDHDFLLREIIRYVRFPPPDVASESRLADGSGDGMEGVDFGAAFPARVFDQHVVSQLKNREGFRYFATVSSLTRHVVSSGDIDFEVAAHRAYLVNKGVTDEELISHILKITAGDDAAFDTLPEVLHPLLSTFLMTQLMMTKAPLSLVGSIALSPI